MELSRTPLFTDNSGALAFATTQKFSTKSKYIDVKFHRIKQLVLNGKIFVQHVATAENVAKLLTKAVDKMT